MLADSQVKTYDMGFPIDPPGFPNHHVTADAPILAVSSATLKLSLVFPPGGHNLGVARDSLATTLTRGPAARYGHD